MAQASRTRSDDAPHPGGPGARRRSGPRPGQTASRRRILETARVAFAANGYAGTSMRGIAREAEVDPSLIVHFFHSKAGLFAATVQWPEGAPAPPDLTGVPRQEVGARWARAFVENWDQGERRDQLISLIRAALTDETAATLLREFITVNFAGRLVEAVRADQPELRAALLTTQLMGFALTRYGIGFSALGEAPDEQVIAILGEQLQRFCTGPLPEPA